MTVKGVGGSKPHQTTAHSAPKPAKSTPPKASAHHTETKQKRPAPSPRESPSALIAAQRGMDVGLLKAKIAARLPGATSASGVSAGARAALSSSTPRVGANRFNQPLDTGRPAGDPDRNRAVNPDRSVRRDGRVYFKTNSKTGTHLFGKDSKSVGTIVGDSVQVDFARSKTIGGEKYVFARGVKLSNGKVSAGYVRESTLPDPRKDRSGAFFFPLDRTKPGFDGKLYDGNGKAINAIAADEVKINYGQQKQIGGDLYYYTLSTRLADGSAVSAWVKASDLSVQPNMKTQAAPPAPAGRVEDYQITGGNPLSRKFGYFDPPNSMDPKDFVSYKVAPRISLAKNKNVAATDYLLRENGLVNLLYSVPGQGGVSTDSFQVKDGGPVVFHRSYSVPEMEVKLYHPKDATHAGEKPVGTMTFVYGSVDTPNGPRYGWIALDALAKPTP